MTPHARPTRPIARAVERLRAGALVAFPTETVYGLGADADNPDAVRAIFAAKGRPADHPVIVHCRHAAVPHWAREIPRGARRLADAFWPGPLTLILPRARGRRTPSPAARIASGCAVPSHPVARALLAAFRAGGRASPRRRPIASAASRRRPRNTSR
jgi:L-threonylcarbamoyladenylate synthase